MALLHEDHQILQELYTKQYRGTFARSCFTAGVDILSIYKTPVHGHACALLKVRQQARHNETSKGQ